MIQNSLHVLLLISNAFITMKNDFFSFHGNCLYEVTTGLKCLFQNIFDITNNLNQGI